VITRFANLYNRLSIVIAYVWYCVCQVDIFSYRCYRFISFFLRCFFYCLPFIGELNIIISCAIHYMLHLSSSEIRVLRTQTCQIICLFSKLFGVSSGFKSVTVRHHTRYARLRSPAYFSDANIAWTAEAIRMMRSTIGLTHAHARGQSVNLRT